MSYYMNQKRQAYGLNDRSPYETIEAQNAEIERLKKQLEQRQVDFKSSIQREFESSPDFENCYSFFLLRFLKEKYYEDFQGSRHFQTFQDAAGDLFTEYENDKKEKNKNGQHNKKGDKPSKADAHEGAE